MQYRKTVREIQSLELHRRAPVSIFSLFRPSTGPAPTRSWNELMNRLFLISLVLAGVLLAIPALSLPRVCQPHRVKVPVLPRRPLRWRDATDVRGPVRQDQLPVPAWAKNSDLTDFFQRHHQHTRCWRGFPDHLTTTGSFPTRRGETGCSRCREIFTSTSAFAQKVFLYLNLNKGVSSGFDAFALMNVLPASGHLKIREIHP